MNDSNLIDEARDSLGHFCMNVCKAKCCKKGYLPVSAQESLLFETDLYNKEEGRVVLAPGCPHLKNEMCSIYERRPKACREFPLYQKHHTILVASWCEGYQAGELKEKLEGLEKNGFKILII